MAVMMTLASLLVIVSTVLLAFSPTVASDNTTECKGVVNLTAEDPFMDNDFDYLVSPGFNQSHPSPIDCEVHIRADHNSSVVVVKLMYFQVDEDQPICTNDQLEFYDGPNTSSPRIKLLCGNMSDDIFESTNSEMTIIFHSDGLKRNNTGFQLQYYSMSKQEDPNKYCNSGSLSASENVNYLNSPKYPDRYPSGLNCQWIITAADSTLIDLHPVDFDLQEYEPSCTSNNLTLYDGNSTSSPIIRVLCGRNLLDHYKSTGPYLTLVFRTSFYGEKFRFEYKSMVKSVICPNTTITATGTEMSITSPDYPNNYGRNMHCQWVITADLPTRVIVLNVVYLILSDQVGPSPCNNDSVSIYDGNSTNSPRTQLLCQYLSRGKFISSGNSMTVVFHSGGVTDFFSGFNFSYTSQDKSDVCISSGLLASNVKKYITSPSYPKNYSSLFDCQWNITSASSGEKVVLEIVSFDVYSSAISCPFDFVTVNDGSTNGLVKMCGHQSYRKFTSVGRLMTVTFKSYGLGSYKGFKFGYSSQLERVTVPCQEQTLTASLTAKDLISSTHPYANPSVMDCKWTIRADTNYVVVLKLKEFNLANVGEHACGSDYVEVYDGSATYSNRITTLCGQQSDGQFNSTTNSMTVLFHSEGGNLKTTDFHFTYQSKKISNAGVLTTAQIALFPIVLIFQILY